MTKTIVITRTYRTSPGRLYDLYMDADLHATVTGGAARIEAKPGSAMSAWDDYIRGKILFAEEGKLVVQTWRTSEWPEGAEDSILVLRFENAGNGKATVTLTNEGVPAESEKEYEKGWKEFYLDKWTDFLETGKPGI
jgi:uncharacterized protein YndB with AHSA1/START domain